jgi:predicted RNA methylase
MKLTKADAALHQQACDLIALARPLTIDEQEFALWHWQESQNATTATALAGAFFTPLDLAFDFAIEVTAGRIIDLGAGIGTLSWAVHRHLTASPSRPRPELVCVERNREYVRVGQRVLPEADWICADLFDLPMDLVGAFDTVIGNPPFGNTPRTGRGPRYTGRRAEYHVIDVAANLARDGVFLIPQHSAPFRYSGSEEFREDRHPEYVRFTQQTGIELEPGCSIDTTTHGGWRGVRPVVEIVTCDFTDRASNRGCLRSPQLPLFAA